MGFRSNRGGTYPYEYIWILTLKGIYAEGLQQGTWKKRIGLRNGNMAEKLSPKETVTFEDLLLSNVIEQEALVNLLEKKGVINKAELLEEIKKLRDKQRR